jgi:hypothetical protein
MKYLLRVLFILALFCGVTSHARADSFHVQVLDPSCVTNPDAACTLLPGDPGTPIGINLTAQTCMDQIAHLPGGVLPAAPFGCFVGTNNTGSSLDGVDISFNAAGIGVASCDTNLPGAIFLVSSCTPPAPNSPNPTYDLSFSGGVVVNSNFFIILETGLPAGDFAGTVTVSAIPEPDSLLLLSTGAMMMVAGLYLKKQRRFAFGKR